MDHPEYHVTENPRRKMGLTILHAGSGGWGFMVLQRAA
jgi:hypothetical protein